MKGKQIKRIIKEAINSLKSQKSKNNQLNEQNDPQPGDLCYYIETSNGGGTCTDDTGNTVMWQDQTVPGPHTWVWGDAPFPPDQPVPGTGNYPGGVTTCGELMQNGIADEPITGNITISGISGTEKYYESPYSSLCLTCMNTYYGYSNQNKLCVCCDSTSTLFPYGYFPQDYTDMLINPDRHTCSAGGVCTPDPNGPFLSLEECEASGCAPTPEDTTCVDFEASSGADQSAICNACSQGNIPPQLSQLCQCCPAPTADPGVAPTTPTGMVTGMPGKPTNVSPAGMAPKMSNKRMMREQVERMQKLANIKKKK